MPVYCVTARHSPLPRKRLIIDAADEDEAVELFLVENRDQAANRKKSGAKLTALVAQWEAGNGAATIDVEYAAPDAPIDLPPPEVLQQADKIPTHLGRLGRRPSKEEEPVVEIKRRRSKKEADFERKRDDQLLRRHEAEEQPDNDRPAYPLPGMEERLAEQTEKKPARKRPRRPDSGGVQVLGVPEDVVPDGAVVEE